jgi:NAD+ diphosphatase
MTEEEVIEGARGGDADALAELYRRFAPRVFGLCRHMLGSVAAAEDATGERAKRCPACNLHAWPRVSPAVIARVTRGNEILLARGRRFPDPIYSVLAGFVDPGESLEEAVVREIREEVGVEVTDLCYFGSQPWPFPHSLMVGFTARWAGGEIRIDEEELVDAAWFDVDALPPVPPRLSIARRLIDDFVASPSRV